MKLKDALLSLAAGYIVTTFPIWEVRDNLWLIWLMATFICLELIIKIEELSIKIKKFRQKRKSALEAATSDRARKIKYFNLIIGN